MSCTSSACNLVTAGGVVHKDTPLWGSWTATPRAGLGVRGDRDQTPVFQSVRGNRKPGESGGQQGRKDSQLAWACCFQREGLRQRLGWGLGGR